MTNPHAAASLRRYPGPPLPSDSHIRLVSLQPGTHHDAPIVCELVTADLSSVPPYEALSYTWGDLSDCQAIYIRARKHEGLSEEGEDQELKELLATRNCVSALRRLRLEHAPRTLWIDALGIDQSNVPERNHQVSLMSQIYTKSAGVTIYLGEADADSDLAIAAIRDVDDPNPKTTTSLSHARSDGLVRALEAFFRRPWFTRVWVIQEAVLSARGTAHCGPQAVEWSAIRNFYEWNTNKRWLASLPFVVSTSRARLVKQTAETSLLSALLRTRHCGASDPRDKVYSLLPLLHSFDGRLGIAPRYGDPVAQVYTDCAAALIREVGYEVLHAVQGEARVRDLASWVPDWSVPQRRKVIGARGSSGRENFWENHKRVEAPHRPTVVERDEQRALRVAGFSAGRIRSLGSTYVAGRGQLPLEEWEALIPAERDIDSFYDKTFYLVIVSDCFAYPSAIRMFLRNERARDAAEATGGDEAGSERRGCDPDNNDDGPNKGLTSWERRVHAMTVERGGGDAGYVLPFEEIPFHEAGYMLVASYAAYVRFVLMNCHSRRFFVTDGGWMGLAPAEAREGDEVFMCVGANAPFVMRECGKDVRDDVKQFRLVGECFMELGAWEQIKGVDEFEVFDLV